MIDINDVDKKRKYLIDKINAYFKQVSKYHPVMSKRVLIDDFDEKVDKGLEIFK